MRDTLAAFTTGFEMETCRLRDAFMAVAVAQDARVETVASAVADILAIAAAKLDREEGKQSLQDRLHAFCGRVEETYNRVRAGAE